MIFRPEVRAGWLHEYYDQAYPIDARLASGGGGVLRAFGPTVGRDAAQIRAGMSAQLSRAFAVYVYYDGIVGRSNYNSNGGSAGLSFSF
jgi:outer membrane autotransporter protein